MKLLAILTLAQQLIGAQFDPDSPVMLVGLSCGDVWVLETSSGAEPLRAGPYDPSRGANVFRRHYLGFEASVTYICNSDRLDWRIISVDLESEELVEQLVNPYVQSMLRNFGAPCWDPNKLSDRQRKLLPNGVPASSLMSRRIVWNINNDRVGSITIPDAPSRSGLWRVLIDAGLPSSNSIGGDAVGQAWELSECRRGDTT